MNAEKQLGRPITPHQKEAIRAWVETGTIKLAAYDLGLDRHTVEAHLANARGRLGIVYPLHLAAWAIKEQIADTSKLP